MTDISKELTIVQPENIKLIVSNAPQSMQDNIVSCQRCIEAGENLLKAIQDNGMTDELDQQAAAFIEKSRKTVKKMNERRSPVTKLFDEIRTRFTSIENAIDPGKADTIPYKLQQLRNQYAAKKREEEERRRREELARQQAEAARAKLKIDVEEDFKGQFQSLLNEKVNNLTELDNEVTLETYDKAYEQIKTCSTELPPEWLYNLHSTVRRPLNVSVDEMRRIELDVKEALGKQFKEQYAAEIQDNKDYILDRMPSKKANLERIAKVNAAEAARMKAEMEERQRKEAEAQEAERKRKEEEERKKSEAARQQLEMGSLFNAQAAVQGYQPKMKVSKKIELLNPEGILPIIGMWWRLEGCNLSVEELSKMFKKQITFCEKVANKDGEFIKDESVEYIDDVKAK